MWSLLFLLTLSFIHIYVQSEAVLVDLERGKNCLVPSGINLALFFYSTFPSEAQYVFEMPSKDAFSPPPIYSGHLHTQSSSDTCTKIIRGISLYLCTWVHL